MRTKFYVITLERSPERKHSVVNNFRKFKIKNYQFIYGLDALKYKEEQLQRLLDKEKLVKPLPPGMIGCCVSHVKAIRAFLEDEDAEYGVIMEDDFLLDNDLSSTLSLIHKDHLSNGPIMLYGYIRTPLTFQKVQSLTEKHSLYCVKQPLQVYSTLGYMLNKDAAKKLLDVIYPIKDSADSWHFFYEQGGFQKLYIIYPFLLDHEVFDSSRVERKQVIADWIIQKKVPLLYQLIRRKRKKYVESHTNLVTFVD